MAIKPLDLPTGAGTDFGLGDVRHFSEDDAMSVPALQNPTRHLAQRDNLIAEKVNEVVSVVNNKEQFVPLPIVRTSIPPVSEEVVTNFRIPVGFEARVLNATIASSPSSSSLTLKVFYNASFGGSTGTELVSTSDEFSAGTSFYNNGELIVSIRNNGASSLEALTSVTLTIRPIGERGSLLVGSVIQGPVGFRGMKGDPGGKGDPGPGAPSVAFVWRNSYSALTDYAPGDSVYYSTTGSSYICLVVNGPSSSVQAPTVAAYWDLLAAGATGSTGTGITYRGSFTSGSWNVLTPWLVNDIVAYNNGTATSTYLCKAAAPSGSAIPPTATTVWDLSASGGSGSGETPTYSHTLLSGAGGASPTVPYMSFGGTYVQGTANNGYVSVSPGTHSNVGLGFYEARITNTATTPKGLAFLNYNQRLTFKGDAYIYLPTIAAGGAIDYAPTDVNCTAIVESNGTAGVTTQLDYVGTNACRVIAYPTYYKIDVVTPEPRNVSISISGIVAKVT